MPNRHGLGISCSTQLGHSHNGATGGQSLEVTGMALLLVAQICPRMGAGWPACGAVHGLGHWVGTHGTLGHQCTMVLPVGGPIAALLVVLCLTPRSQVQVPPTEFRSPIVSDTGPCIGHTKRFEDPA